MQIVTKSVRLVETPIPYVTNGLIAMWDAEWNKRCCLHDPSYGKLAELCHTGNDLAINSTYGELHDKFLHCSGLGIAAAGSAELPAFDKQQIEIVFRFIAKGAATTNYSLVDLYHGPNYVSGSYFRRFALYVRSSNVLGFSSQSGTLLAPFENRINSTSTACNIAGGEQAFATTLYANDNGPITLSPQGGCASPYVVPTLGASAECDIYSIRIYNRQLDVREINHNYNIDKERFSL